MTSIVAPETADLAALRQKLAERLGELAGRIRLRLAFDTLATSLVAGVALLGVAFVLDYWLEPSRPVRIACVVLGALAVGSILVRGASGLIGLGLGPVELAGELDKARSAPPAQWIAPRVATVLQLSTGGPGVSTAMAERAVRDSARVLDQVEFSQQLDERHARRCAAACLAALAVPLVFALFAPREVSSLWFRRWVLGSNESWPRDTSIEVLGLVGGRLIVPRGESAVVRVAVRDRRTPTETVWISIQPPGGEAETATMVRFGEGDFRFELPPQHEPVLADFRAGDGRAGPVEIAPVDRPRIAAMTLVHKHPRDPAPQTHSFTGEEGNVRLLKKTDAELVVACNVPIATLEASGDGPAPPPFARVDERTFRAHWIHEGPVSMRIVLVDRDWSLSSRPNPVSIGLREDRPPQVNLTHSGVGAWVSPSAMIPLKVAARDDFAIEEAALAFKAVRGSSPAEKGDVAPAPPADIPPRRLERAPESASAEPTLEASYDWDLQSLKLVPGDTVSTVAEARDDCYTGPQTARSRTLAFRVVSATELFREILLRQQQFRARLRRAADQAEGLRDALRTAPLPGEAEALLRRHNLIQREVWQVMHGIEDSATEMRLNRLGGPETYELIKRTVVDPLERLHEDLMTRQRQGLESARQPATGSGAGPKSDAPAAESAQQLVARQQEILDAMQKILKNMAQWDNFIDVVNQLNEVIKLQQAVRERTEELKKKQFESIFDSR
jgi:hypothetical protein